MAIQPHQSFQDKEWHDLNTLFKAHFAIKTSVIVVVVDGERSGLLGGSTGLRGGRSRVGHWYFY
jgi:Zn-dependent M28 family amino/carboxypeptidase